MHKPVLISKKMLPRGQIHILFVSPSSPTNEMRYMNTMSILCESNRGYLQVFRDGFQAQGNIFCIISSEMERINGEDLSSYFEIEISISSWKSTLINQRIKFCLWRTDGLQDKSIEHMILFLEETVR